MPPVYLSGESRGSSSASGTLTVDQVVRQLREADLSEQQLRNMLVHLLADDRAVADPEVERIFVDFIRRYGPTGVNLLGIVMAIILAVFGVQADRRAGRAEELTERQTDIAEQQLPHDREQDAPERGRGRSPSKTRRRSPRPSRGRLPPNLRPVTGRATGRNAAPEG